MGTEYTYQVVWEDDNDQQREKKWKDKDEAKAHYDRLPTSRFKALWQFRRNPYVEALMVVNNPRKIKTLRR